jgi:uncharacterized protein (DUF2252 family)
MVAAAGGGHDDTIRMTKHKIQTPEQRRQAGKLLRRKCLRESHGKVILGQGNKRDVVRMITSSNKNRLQNLVPIRHGRMLQSAFAFFRGTANIQAHDLAGTPSSGIIVQACGDCHLMNFGGFATPERNIIFDINDFDETDRAPFEWDLKRLAASFVIAARWRGFKHGEAREIAVEAARSYRRSMHARADATILEGWYSRTSAKEVTKISEKITGTSARIRKRRAEAHKRTGEQVFHKLTAQDRNGLSRIVDQPPLLYHTKDVSDKSVRAFFAGYRSTLPAERRFLFDRFTYVDAAIKVVGVGSVGTFCFVALFLAAPGDPLFLQVKEAGPSVLQGRAGGKRAANNGQRVVEGQRLIQSASDIFLGWAKGPKGRNFYVRQLRDMKVSAEVETMSPKVMNFYASLCGMALARAHNKAGDAAMIAGYLGKSDEFDQAIGDYAVAYADQVERDYATFVKAARDGRLKSDLGKSELAELLR